MPKVYRFVVEGSGSFPVDMLRFDACWPEREDEDSYRGVGATGDTGVRQVRLLTIKPQVTIGRWESFTWRVVEQPKLVR